MICEDEPTPCHTQRQVLPGPDDLMITKKLNQAKFTIFNAYSASRNQNFAVKVFPYQNGQVSSYFLKEAYFLSFDHQNVISIVDCRLQQAMPVQGQYMQISYIVMELAPFGDFFDMIMKHKIKFSEKLARTFFHQLVEGTEYIHSKGAAHLDLKLENLLLGDNFQLKIADFDTAYVQGQNQINSKGTVSYRAPEIRSSSCKDPQAADIYSMGIILFLFQTGGKLPHREQITHNGLDFLDLLINNKPLFWKKHCEAQRKESSFFSDDFRNLFETMTEFDPLKRANIGSIKNSNWFNGDVFSNEELQFIMTEKFKEIN